MSSISSIGNSLIRPAGLEKSLNSPVTKQFSERINEMLDNVNQSQLDAGEIANKFAKGELEDIHDVIIASEKASVGLDLVLEVRNKLIDAYREVMRMQV
jgi:flagellar hook-basal body complex protein FliE